MSVAAIYELATPFSETDLASLKFEQTADLVVISRMGMPVKRLRRFGHSNWKLDNAPIGPTVQPPASVTVGVVNPKSGDEDYVGEGKTYVVTSVTEEGQESVPSPSGSGINDLNLKGDHNVITWPIVPGIRTYKVYEHRSGMYGYLGTVRDGLAFKDDNILANFADGPPQHYDPFETETPDVVGFHESRLWAGRFITRPNVFVASRTDDLFNFDKSTPLRATDSITLSLRSRRQNAIRHMVSMKDLLLLTGDTIYSIRSTSDDVISPLTIKAVPEKYQGCGTAKPEVVDDLFFYTSPRGDSIRTGGYTFEKDGYSGNNVSIFAQHLFDRFEVMEMAWAQSPSSVLWCRRNDGKLAALTWMREQEVWGWTLCYTDGVVESICVVPEQGRDALYALIRRTIDGGQKRYVERLADPVWTDEDWSDLSGAILLDCSDYIERDEPFNTVTRADWLEGRDVVCLGDGVVYRGHKIIDGALVPPLPVPVKRLVFGIPYESYLQTLPFVSQGQQGVTMGNGSNISEVVLNVINTAGFGDGLLVGANLKLDGRPDLSLPPPEDVLTQTPPAPFTGIVRGDVDPGHWDDASVSIWQTDPLPMVVTGIYYNIDIGRRS